MLAEAAARVGGLGRTGSCRRVADAATLPFADASFDIVLAAHMLYHLPRPADGVAEIARVLRRGGTALVATNGAGMLRELFALQAQVWPGQAVDPAHERLAWRTAN